MDQASRVQELIRDASRVEVASSHAPDVVPFCKKILEIIHRHPSLKPLFEDVFLDSYRDFDNGYLVVQYCMHHLRWLSLRGVFEVRFEDAVKNEELHEISRTRYVLDSFETDWKDREQFGI